LPCRRPPPRCSAAAMPGMDMAAHHHHGARPLPPQGPAAPAPPGPLPKGTDQAPGQNRQPWPSRRPLLGSGGHGQGAKGDDGATFVARLCRDEDRSGRISARPRANRAAMAGAGKAKAGWATPIAWCCARAAKVRRAAGWNRPNWKRPIRARSARGGTCRRACGRISAPPARTHAMLAVEGLAPYRFDAGGAFVSDRGSSPRVSRARWMSGSPAAWCCNRAPRSTFQRRTCPPSAWARG
jgi:hypothetical protein